MSARWSASLVWALAAALAVFWGLRLFVPATPVPPQARLAEAGGALAGDLTRLLGAAPAAVDTTVAAPPPEAATRFRLSGIVATSHDITRGTAGVAILAVDGKPARAYRVGEPLDEAGQFRLASVGLRSARITAAGGTGFTLDLPPPAAAATGTPGVAGAAVPPMPLGGAVPAPGAPPYVGAPPAGAAPLSPVNPPTYAPPFTPPASPPPGTVSATGNPIPGLPNALSPAGAGGMTPDGRNPATVQ